MTIFLFSPVWAGSVGYNANTLSDLYLEAAIQYSLNWSLIIQIDHSPDEHCCSGDMNPVFSDCANL